MLGWPSMMQLLSDAVALGYDCRQWEKEREAQQASTKSNHGVSQFVLFVVCLSVVCQFVLEYPNRAQTYQILVAFAGPNNCYLG